ncbi:MAG TPA: hypothetical protein VFW23_14745, partial [Tepidisphaeraceae bacterium]|nr:hypothetical protein [Tepidisphaeraceae bacterium]
MKSAICWCAFAILAFFISPLVEAKDSPKQSAYFEQDVSASDPLRTQQAKELDAYIEAMKKDDSRLHALFHPDYSSPQAFAKSAEPYRAAFCDSIGYPPPGEVPSAPPTFDQIGQDSIATYYRATIAILPEVH